MNIYLYNDDKTPFEARWDGKDYVIDKEPIEIEQGIAEHWSNLYPAANLRIEEVPQEVIEKRQPLNPLEDNNRGEAFAALKKPQRRKASGE